MMRSMNVVLNQQSPANISYGNGVHSSVVFFPAAAAASSRGASNLLQHPRHQADHIACHRPHLLPAAAAASTNTLVRCSVQPSRSSCSPAAPMQVGDSINNGPGSPQWDDDEETEQYYSIKRLPGPEPATRCTDHLSHDHHQQLPAGEEVVLVKGKASASYPGAAGDVEYLGPRSGTTLGLVRSLMADDRYSRLTQDYYHTRPGSHLDRQRQHQQLLSPDHEELPRPRVVTLAVSVSSAVKLESKQMDQIAKKMKKLTGFENLRMENTVDPSLIAGFVIRYGEDDAHVIDLSVKGRLAELEARLQSSEQSGAGAGGGWSFPDMH